MNEIEKVEFFDQYMDPLVTDEALVAAFDFKEKRLPSSLFYRYRRFSDRTIKEIQTRKIRVSPASKQNDSKDSSLNFSAREVALAQTQTNIDNRERWINRVN